MISMVTKGNCTFLNATGDVNATDIVVQTTKCLSDKKTDTYLWDFSHASKIDISTEEMKGIASSIQEVPMNGKVRKVALVSSKNINIGLLKVFVAIAEIHNSPNEHRVFRNIELAKDWLQKTTGGN